MGQNFIDSSITFHINPIQNNTIFSNYSRYILPNGFLVEGNGHSYKINYPFFSIQFQEDKFFLVSSLFELFIEEHSFPDLLKELGNEIDFMWNFYVFSKDDDLDDSAVDLKDTLLRYVELVK